MDFTGTVVWDDGNDVCKKRPSNIAVYLYKDNVYTNNYKTINGTSDTWTATWTGLEQGTYTIGVTTPDVYTAAYSNSNKTVTLYRPTTRTFTTNVVWDDDGNAYKTRENYVDVYRISSDASVQENKLQRIGYKNDEVTPRENVTINGNTWIYSESNLPNIDYSISYTDNPEEGYDYSISGNTITFTLKKYTVTWKNGSTALETDTNVPYGSTPRYDGATPTKADDTQYTYTFTGWESLNTGTVYAVGETLPTVTDNETYTAQFDSTPKNCTITWLNDDGTLIGTTSVAYGETPTHANPTKPDTAQYTYTFNGWTPAIKAVTGDATYKATYTSSLRSYTYYMER